MRKPVNEWNKKVIFNAFSNITTNYQCRYLQLKSKTHVTIMAEKLNHFFSLIITVLVYIRTIKDVLMTSKFSVQSEKDITRPNSENLVQRKEL